MNKHYAALTEQEEELARTPAAVEVPTVAGFAVGDSVAVDCRGHRLDGRTGQVSYLGTLLLTVGVSIDGEDYGFFPAELTPATDPEPERQP